MKIRNRLFLCTVILLIAALPACAAYISAPAGYVVQDMVFPIPYAWSVYGFDLMPNGNFVVFIDQDIVEIASTGEMSAPLYSFASSVYGSFVKVRGSFVYFGESSNGTIWRMGLDGSGPVQLGSLGNPYDLEFDSLGQAFVSANPGWAGQKIFYFDGAGDEIVNGLDGYSGPLAFDASDNLLYATAYAALGDSLLRFDRSDVLEAIGAGTLTSTDGQALASINAPFDMELDALGNAFLTSGDTLYRLHGGSSTADSFATSQYVMTTLRYNPTDGGLSILLGGATDGGGSPVGVISTLVPVPEPSTLIALAGLTSLAGMKALRRKERTVAAEGAFRDSHLRDLHT